ncbi:hypothetical protein FHS72_000084 [Loktanella ponticola]|uniref:Uncharacterized protein n=1 Tax=Yoonia ponticola TaxID=1524255 RepID=A0A7W9BHB1_9RHOB|nr:hypothetical protein [Yoonia ponticola]MBB5720480.1 hypothetical protein [Yoonia ponticola]
MPPKAAQPFLVELMSRDPERVAAALQDAAWEKSPAAYDALLQQAKQVYFALPRELPTRQDTQRKWAFAALLYETRDTAPSNMACGCYMSNASPKEVETVEIVSQTSDDQFHVHCDACRIDYDVTAEHFETGEPDWRWKPRL